MQTGNTETIPGATKFGVYPRVGFEAGHFRLSCEYNAVKGGGYLGVKVGAFIGGGRKKG